MASFEASIAALDPGVLRSLGPAETLARAYVVELLMNPRTQRLKAAVRFLKLAGIVVAGGFATLFVVTMLGSIGITFTASGLVVFGLGLLETSGIHLPGVQLSGIPPAWVIAMGPPLTAIGLVAMVLLRTYIRFVARTMRKTLPRGIATA
jgi:hypothetical protein